VRHTLEYIAAESRYYNAPKGWFIVGKFNLWWILRNIIGGIGWKVFIWGLGVSQETYWQEIYEQELARKSEESAATPSNIARPT
jgi:hypothetical protein